VHFVIASRVLVLGAWGSFALCLIDIFFLQTVVTGVMAAAVSALVSLIVAGYLDYQARSKYGQTFIMNNG
jgi:hypothetical protein